MGDHADEDLRAAEERIAALTAAVHGLLEQAPLGIPHDRRAMDEARAAAHAVVDEPYHRWSCWRFTGPCLDCDGRGHNHEPDGCARCHGRGVGCDETCGCPCHTDDLTTNQENNQQ